MGAAGGYLNTSEVTAGEFRHNASGTRPHFLRGRSCGLVGFQPQRIISILIGRNGCLPPRARRPPVSYAGRQTLPRSAALVYWAPGCRGFSNCMISSTQAKV